MYQERADLILLFMARDRLIGINAFQTIIEKTNKLMGLINANFELILMVTILVAIVLKK